MNDLIYLLLGAISALGSALTYFFIFRAERTKAGKPAHGAPALATAERHR